MAEAITCYACDRDPVGQCPRCGRPFCEDHGDEVCAVCLHPASAVPSFNLYRGSLLALLIGAGLALWLIVQPTGGDTESSLGPTIVTPTPTSAALTTPVASPALTPVEGTVPAGATTPAAEPTQPAGTVGTEYTVESGDTLSSICAELGPASLSIAECVEEIMRLNGLQSDVISVGQVLTLPQ